MRHAFLFCGIASLLVSVLASPAAAQVNEAERAAARDLFKQGDELQRDAHFEEALSKFQRAEQLYSAPTNELRIAECDAALGRLAESAETYRTVLRSPLPHGSPPAFQAAVDQARAELQQVEPRLPKLTIVVQPANVVRPALEVDGQSVPAALIGEAVPLDPGPHRIAVSAAGYPKVEQTLVLKEGEARVVLLSLLPAPLAPLPPPPLAPLPPPAPPPPVDGMVAGTPEPPPPPPVILDRSEEPRRPSWKGVLLGGHLGGAWIGGSIPRSGDETGGGSVDASSLVGGGVSYGLDAGLRFARRWYVGLTFDHANYATATNSEGRTTSADTTLVGAVIGAVVNPDRTSFYGEAGVVARWLTVRGDTDSGTFSGPELELGVGLWLPVGHSVRLLPKATVTLGDFSSDSTTSSGTSSMSGRTDGKNTAGHAIFGLVLAGFYNLDL